MIQIQIELNYDGGIENAENILKDFWALDLKNKTRTFLNSIDSIIEKYKDYFDIEKFDFRNKNDSTELYAKLYALGTVYWYCDKCEKHIFTLKDKMKREDLKNEFTYSHLCEKDNPNESFIHSFNKLNKVLKYAFKSFDEFEKWYVSKLMNYGGIKMFEIYEDEKGIGIRSNAKDEREFLEWASKLISRIIFEKKSIQRLVQNPEFKNEHEKAIEKRLKNFFPKIVEICCKYRGYKAEVTEQRVLIAGQILGGDPQFSLDEKTK